MKHRMNHKTGTNGRVKRRVLANSNGKPTGLVVFKQLVANLLLSSRESYLGGSNIDQGGLDLDKECKYPKNPSPTLFWKLYNSNGIARRVNDFLPDECWATPPEIYETEKQREAPFEKAVRKMATKVNLWAQMHLLDKLRGIGQYGGLFCGYNDGGEGRKLSLPVAGFNDKGERTQGRPANLELAYVRAYHQGPMRIKKTDTDEMSPRYGWPTLYGIKMAPTNEGLAVAGSDVPPSNVGKEIDVHWTRVIHSAEPGPNPVFGTERMRPVLPQIFDCRKILGGSGEMFYKGGFPGIVFETHPNMEDPDLDEDSLKKEIEEYALGLKRYMRLIGMVAKSLAPQVADPTNHMTEQYQAICIAFASPMRIFMGAEAGHLASQQDKESWNGRLSLRQLLNLTTTMVRPFFDRQILFGTLPTPSDMEYMCSWKDLNALTEADRADFALKMTQALLQYVTSGAFKVMRPMAFFTNVLRYTLAEAKAMIEENGGEEKIMKGLQAVVDATAGNTKDTTTTNPTKSTGAGGQRNGQGKGKPPRGSKTPAKRR